MDVFLPTRTVRFDRYRHKRSSLITQGLIRSIQNRDRLYRRLKETKPNSPFLHEREDKLQRVNKILKQSIRLAKKMYYVSRFESIKDNARKMLENIRMVLNNTKKSAPSPLHFFVNNKIESDGLNIANEFNKYITNIGTDLANKIPNTDKNDFRRHLLRMHCESSFSFKYTTPGDVSKLISKLKTKNSAGHDRMSNKLLQKIRSSLSPALSLIINQSLFTGIFSDSLKIAKILPLFKKGDPSYFGNYGPISHLPAISKVFEKVVFIQIYKYFNSNNLLHKSQYGFRANHSTELAGIEFVVKYCTIHMINIRPFQYS